MYAVIAYDISENRAREKVRRILWRHSMAPISKSVYIGKIGYAELRTLLYKLSRVVGRSDIIVAIPIPSTEIRRLLYVVANQVRTHRSIYDAILVIGGFDESDLHPSEDPR